MIRSSFIMFCLSCSWRFWCFNFGFYDWDFINYFYYILSAEFQAGRVRWVYAENRSWAYNNWVLGCTLWDEESLKTNIRVYFNIWDCLCFDSLIRACWTLIIFPVWFWSIYLDLMLWVHLGLFLGLGLLCLILLYKLWILCQPHLTPTWREIPGLPCTFRYLY